MRKATLFLGLISGLTSVSTAIASYSFSAYPEYLPSSALYITLGGGAGGLENSDWEREPNKPGYYQVNQPSSKENSVGTVNAAIGYQLNKLPFRVEADYRWFSKADYTWDKLYVPAGATIAGSGTIESQAILFNAYYDWYNSTRFTPFIGAGIGYYINRSTFELAHISSDEESNTNDGFSWGASLGVKYEITSYLFLDLRAEYLNLGEVQIYEFAGGGRKPLMETTDVYAISGLANLTYAFNLGF